ncbi:hypothetical protein [Acuticoccus sediminis]|uniref:hypothetical protein n=1 Tax=Acuticoccus sediminis TaxID=2184697 RepID=UPI001CFE3A0F|nr:hypothetical protein [Acuticoccus sediminis]
MTTQPDDRSPAPQDAPQRPRAVTAEEWAAMQRFVTPLLDRLQATPAAPDPAPFRPRHYPGRT